MRRNKIATPNGTSKTNLSKKIAMRITIMVCLMTILLTSGMASLPAQIKIISQSFGDYDTQVISSQSNGDSTYPEVAVDSKNNIHAIWNDWADYNGAGSLDIDIFYRMWNATSFTWGNTVVVSDQSTEHSTNVDFVIDDQDNLHIVWTDATNISNAGDDFDIFYKKWDATSLIWGNMVLVSTQSNYDSYNPNIDVDNQNNIHVVWNDPTDYGGGGLDTDVVYRRWDSTFQSWGNIALISTNSGSPSYAPIVKVDQSNNIHIAWQDQANYNGAGTDWDIFYKRWNASTSLWETTEVISVESNNVARFPSMALDSDNNLFVVWQDLANYNGAGPDHDIFLKQLNSTTLAWGGPVLISTESDDASTDSYVHIDSTNRVHIVWTDSSDYNAAGTDRDIFYKQWDPLFNAWKATEVISTESPVESSIPRIAVDGLNNIHIVWNDQTNHTNAGSDYDIFYKTDMQIRTVTQTDTTTQTETDIQTSTLTDTQISTETGTNITITSPVTTTETSVSTQISTLISEITSTKTESPSPGLYVIGLSFVMLVIQKKKRKR